MKQLRSHFGSSSLQRDAFDDTSAFCEESIDGLEIANAHVLWIAIWNVRRSGSILDASARAIMDGFMGWREAYTSTGC